MSSPTAAPRGGGLAFTPEASQVHADARAPQPVAEVVDGLVTAHPAAAEVIDEAGWPTVWARGEWVHGSDIRDALGEDDACAGAGIELAVPLPLDRSRVQRAPTVHVMLDGDELAAGVGLPTVVRRCADRSPGPDRYRLEDVDPVELTLCS